MKKKISLPVLTRLEVMDAGSEGKAVARSGEMVVFIPFAAPGDIVDIQLTRKKKSFAEGRIIRFHKHSERRAEPFCQHFGTCGGCKWQHLKYDEQLAFKQKQVEDNLLRIGKLEIKHVLPIRPSNRIMYYRNKLEFTFSNRRWLTGNGGSCGKTPTDMRALGFHIPGMFDRVLDIETCYLQAEPSNAIRLTVKKYAMENELTFYDAKKWTGFLRNLIIRNTLDGQWMVIFVFQHENEHAIRGLMDHIGEAFPQIASLNYVINDKRNDTLNDLELRFYKGTPWLMETMPSFGTAGTLRFKISPLSFFQTNTTQAIELYQIAGAFANPAMNDTVYDLYTGTGTIANFIARKAARVIGIDSVYSAITDARENSRVNGITNTHFFHGDISGLLTAEFVRENGTPDIVITDPPRTGMHEKVIRQLMQLLPDRMVYISCNPATQARDLAMLQEHYSVSRIQPVDMFPHTQHVENVALLVKRKDHAET